MSSVFSPIYSKTHAIKTTYSCQEWCGQTYIQLNNKNQYEVESHSYFEKNNDKKYTLRKDNLENEVWTILRISPEDLPIGEIQMIPSMEYLGLHHKAIKSYVANATFEKRDGLMFYTLEYPQLERTLIIQCADQFPFEIDSWEETISTTSGTSLTTRAEKIKRIKSDYWNRNSVSDLHLRERLGL